MAARKGPLTETKLDEMRRRIKTTLLLKKLEDHVLSGKEMKASQIKAATTLLKKTIPDLSAVEHSGDMTIRSLAQELAGLNAN